MFSYLLVYLVSFDYILDHQFATMLVEIYVITYVCVCIYIHIYIYFFFKKGKEIFANKKTAPTPFRSMYVFA